MQRAVDLVNFAIANMPAPLAEVIAWVFASWFAWACFTVVMCAHVYVPVILTRIFGFQSQWLDRQVGRVVIINIIAAVAPCLLPLVAIWYIIPWMYRMGRAIYRWYTNQPAARRNNNQGPRVVHNHYHVNQAPNPGRRGGGQHRPRPNQPRRPARP